MYVYKCSYQIHSLKENIVSRNIFTQNILIVLKYINTEIFSNPSLIKLYMHVMKMVIRFPIFSLAVSPQPQHLTQFPQLSYICLSVLRLFFPVRKCWALTSSWMEVIFKKNKVDFSVPLEVMLYSAVLKSQHPAS